MTARAVIFDLMGTLMDNHSFVGHPSEDWRAMQKAMAETLGADAASFTGAWDETWRLRATGGFTTLEACFDGLCQRLGVEATAVAVSAAATIRMDYARRALVPRPDALETLGALRERGLQLAVISNCIPDVPLLWEGTPLADLINATLFSCVERVMKPDPRIFELACERLGVSPEDCLYVADGEGGELAAASAMGMRAVLIRSSYRDPPGFRRPHVEPWEGAEIAHLSEVLELL